MTKCEIEIRERIRKDRTNHNDSILTLQESHIVINALQRLEGIEAENAALRERSEKAVELPDPSIVPNFYGFVLTWYTVEEHKKLYDSEKEAEAHLAELKEEK